jgi:hypothetical protein
MGLDLIYGAPRTTTEESVVSEIEETSKHMTFTVLVLLFLK